MNSILNLLFEFPSSSSSFIPAAAATFISISIAVGRGLIPKAKRRGRDGKEAIFNGFKGAVNDGVDCVYDLVDEGLD